ncbi:hypothetical protein JX265_011123 [Neoarthrinium moseri]|uniref:Uncharacterized protein n=1 Tax=Neoarthrinium moseri TaxID=1658444 RepID=A0A9P9WDB2_9PEZI|nr:uncharacterized protein JN550_005103 [Neoarthrinium moseri]KAI1852487.1 hypothetical protein JX266_002665 [Neoarthrinium moseri]KAI1857708.1 hypothetical protein JX265_011123 [Neoarthrinium moseri]KAI1870560.1 hypothetical protein JN550_005103 [Neoarthrinium moseri]
MATFEVTRDMRGAAQDPKREKERYTKWSRGTRPSAGCKINSLDDMIITGSDAQRAKVRPQRAFDNPHVRSHNIVKAKLPYDLKPSHSRAKVDAMEELNDPAISRSLIDLLPTPNTRRRLSVVDHVLYSFDQTESPSKPLSLEVFVKTNPKETEKLVEKEYEILDYNGDALTGKKARRNLRSQGLHSASEEPAIIEDDGFELV